MTVNVDLVRHPYISTGVAPILVTGGAGFIGSNLADRLAREGNDVLVFDSLTRPGVERNLDWLRRRHPRRIAGVVADIRDDAAVKGAVRRCTAVFHFAAQVAVTTSLEDPRSDLEVNLLGTASLLEALRNASSPVPIVFASTNKVYGGLDDVPLTQANGAYVPCDPVCRSEGFDETRALEFHTPYGCSKGAADQYVLDYARSFSLPTAVLRMSCIYGPRQLGTEDQGWVAHFLLRALAGEPIVVYGDGKQVRDVLHVDDAVSAYIAVWRNIARVRGRAFNLGGGPRNAISLLQLLRYIGKLTGRPPQVRFADWRPNDQRYYVSNTGRIRETLHLAEPIGWQEGVAGLLKHFMESGGARRVPHLARAVPA